MISPNKEVLYCAHLTSSPIPNHVEGSIVVDSCTSSPILFFYSFSEVRPNEGACVGSIANHDNFTFISGVLIDKFSLFNKNLGIPF